jgi:DNA (cytosine-5)-methyltransferase 1
VDCNKIKIATVFSGIGAPEQALKKIGLPFEIVFACDNGERTLELDGEKLRAFFQSKGIAQSEWPSAVKKLYSELKTPNFVKQSYFSNYSISEDRWFEDIRFLKGNAFRGGVDLFIGGSPCQSFSIIGKKAGLEDARGTLFYDFARLIKEIQPKAFIYENVPGMLMHDHGNTWRVIKDIFESLGYSIGYSVLNSKDYGIPQDRRRLFAVGLRDSNRFVFPSPKPLNTCMNDYLEERVDAQYYLGEKGFRFVTNPKYKNRARVNREIIQTEKANQQFNWNGDFVFEDEEKIAGRDDVFARAYVGEWSGRRGVIRKLTERECLRLMGFPDDFKIVVPSVQAYRQAGNSMVVNVMESLIRSILGVEEMDKLC